MDSWAWTTLYHGIGWSNRLGTGLLTTLGEMGYLTAALWPLALTLLRLLFTRRLPGTAAPMLLALLGFLFSHGYMTPLYHEWQHECKLDELNMRDYDRFCLYATPQSLTFIKACIDTSVELGKWPVVRAHVRVVDALITRASAFATHPATLVLLALAAAACAAYATQVALPAIERRRLDRHHGRLAAAAAQAPTCRT